MRNNWFVQIAANTGGQLAWNSVQVEGVELGFPEKERKNADRAAISLSELAGSAWVVRVVHRYGNKRGCFIPSPLPARHI